MRAVVLVFLADAVTFALAVAVFGVPIEAESNPTMVAAYLAAGLAGVVVWKAFLLGLVLAALSRIRTRSRRPGILVAYAITLAGAASNIVAILR